MGIVENGCGVEPDKEVLEALANLNEHRKTNYIIFTNRRLRRFIRMFYDYILLLLEKRDGTKKDKTSTG